jgi:hypothetical protein
MKFHRLNYLYVLQLLHRVQELVKDFRNICVAVTAHYRSASVKMASLCNSRCYSRQEMTFWLCLMAEPKIRHRSFCGVATERSGNHVGYVAVSSHTAYQRSGWQVNSIMNEVMYNVSMFLLC